MLISKFYFLECHGSPPRILSWRLRWYIKISLFVPSTQVHQWSPSNITLCFFSKFFLSFFNFFTCHTHFYVTYFLIYLFIFFSYRFSQYKASYKMPALPPKYPVWGVHLRRPIIRQRTKAIEVPNRLSVLFSVFEIFSNNSIA